MLTVLNCVKVVCDDCSKARVQLAYMDDRLGRVCPLCYADYLEMRSTSSLATPPTPLASPSPNTDTTLTPRSAENKHGSDRIGSGKHVLDAFLNQCQSFIFLDLCAVI